MMLDVNTIWYRKHWLAYCLWPLSLLYQLIILIRKYLYRFNIFKQHHVAVPVIVVGNITVGGTGKTPLVIWLAQWLQQQGYRPGIVSKGYGGQATHWPQRVASDSDPRMVGDEPVMIVRRAQCPMVVAPKRVEAIRQLLEEFQCDMVISDDGLQHYAMGRDLEIAVVDAQRYLGNGFCLPAGPLREPASRLNHVQIVVSNGQTTENLVKHHFILQADGFYSVKDNLACSIDELRETDMHAFAGIGNPQRFFNQLCDMGLSVIPHKFMDHHRYQLSDIIFDDNLKVIMTEKDAVKCVQFADSRHFYLAVDCVPNQSFIEYISKWLEGLSNKKL